MSRVESPFHAIVTAALDHDVPDVPDDEVEVEVGFKVNGSAAAAAAANVIAMTSSEAKGQEGDVVKKGKFIRGSCWSPWIGVQSTFPAAVV
jgi:hypothetical protein